MFDIFKNRKLAKDFRLALNDGQLTTAEHDQLLVRAKELGLNSDKLTELQTKDFKIQTKLLRETIVRTRRITKQQLQEFYAIADKLNIEPQFEPDFEKYWQLTCWDAGEQLQLSEIASPSLLKKGESAFYAGKSTWSQMKTVKTRAGSHGFSASFRIVKGLRYRADTVRPVYTSHDELVDLSTGQITITNRRILFEGAPKSTAIPYARILDIEAYNDGVQIMKSSGKNDFFRLSQTDSEFCSMLVENFYGG
jgi:hypothetical protein